MLTRIYGISFPKQKLLDEYLLFLEEAKRRDHRRIGKELELFTFSPTWNGAATVAAERRRDQADTDRFSYLNTQEKRI